MDPASLQSAKGLIRVAENRVDATFAPPAQFERRQPLRQFAGMVVAQEEIIVVKLDGIDAKALLKVP